MSSKQPSGDPADPFPPRAGSPPETGLGSGKRIVFVILGFLGLCGLLCCGVFGAGYLLFQRYQAANRSGTVNIELPRRYDAFAHDAKTFNASIQRRLQTLNQSVTCSDPSLTEFIDATMVLLKNGQPARFHVATFLKSIDKSESANGSVPLLTRLILSRGLGAGETLSPSVDDHYELLEVRLAPDGMLAEVDLLVYSSDNLTTSQQWYVVKADSGWHLYDWQRLEFGRRLADERLPARESIDAILAGQMLKQERYVDVLERWPGDMQRLIQLSEDVIALSDADILRRLLGACDAWTSQPIDILRQRLETELLFRQSADANSIDAGHRQLLDLVHAVDSELPLGIQHQLSQRHARDRAWAARLGGLGQSARGDLWGDQDRSGRWRHGVSRKASGTRR